MERSLGPYFAARRLCSKRNHVSQLILFPKAPPAIPKGPSAAYPVPIQGTGLSSLFLSIIDYTVKLSQIIAIAALGQFPLAIMPFLCQRAITCPSSDVSYRRTASCSFSRTSRIVARSDSASVFPAGTDISLSCPASAWTGRS